MKYQKTSITLRKLKRKTVNEQNSIRFLIKLQECFAFLWKSKQTVFDPAGILENVFDQFGDKVVIGGQRDLLEYYLIVSALIVLGFKTVYNIHGTPDKLKLIENLFTGYVKSSMYDEEMNMTSTSHPEELGIIVVQPDTEHLFEAIKKKFWYTINIEDEEGYEVKKTKKEWVTKLPDLLLIQINRLTYDYTTGKQTKNNNRLWFDMSIDLAMFFEEYKKDIVKFEKSNLEKQEQLEEIEEQLKELEGNLRKDSNVNLIDCLNGLKTLLKNQSKYKKNESRRYIKEFSDFEEDLVEKLERRIKKLEKKRKTLREKKDKNQLNSKKFYNEFKGNAYNLKAVILHEGDANEGHYFSYNKIGNKWFYMNDSKTKEVDLQKVIIDSLGMYEKDRNAYCLVYEKKGMEQGKTNGSSSFITVSDDLTQTIMEDDDKKCNTTTKKVLEKILPLIDNLPVGNGLTNTAMNLAGFRLFLPKIL